MMKTKNNTQFTLSKTTIILSTRLCLFTASVVLATTSAAATNENTAYVDSIHQWGAWELDIEPAAGGLKAQTTQALNVRDSKVRLRTNSISALAPPQRAKTIRQAPVPAPVPISAPAPVIPSLPVITPIRPGVPVPVGGPSDGF